MKKLITIIIIIAALASNTYAKENKDEYYISAGAGYPYLTLRYNYRKYFSPELRIAVGEGVNIYGARAYYELLRFDLAKVYCGLEAGYIAFDTLDIKGWGYDGGIFAGFEFKLSGLGGGLKSMERLTLLIDIMPAYIYVESEGLSEKGIEFILNMAVNYRFFKKDPDALAKKLAKKKLSRKQQMKKYFEKGQQYFKEEDFENAIRYYNKVLKINPKHEISKTNIKRAKYMMSLENMITPDNK